MIMTTRSIENELNLSKILDAWDAHVNLEFTIWQYEQGAELSKNSYNIIQSVCNQWLDDGTYTIDDVLSGNFNQRFPPEFINNWLSKKMAEGGLTLEQESQIIIKIALS